MRRYSTPKSLIALGVLLPTLIVGISGEASSQQRPLSISDWLKAEQNNANMQRAVEEYERAQFNSVPPQQQRYQQPANPQLQQQAQTPNPQAPRQWSPPAGQQQEPDPLPGGEIPQRGTEPNTYKVPENALEKIDKQYGEASPQNSNASSGYYVSASLGWGVSAESNYDISSGNFNAEASFLSFRATSSLGYQLKDGFALEIGGSYQRFDVDDVSGTSTGSNLTVVNNEGEGSVSMYSLTANIKKEFNIQQPFTPYIMSGVGLGLHKAKDVQGSGATTSVDGLGFALVYQFGAGIMYPVSKQTSLDLGYRYFGTSDTDIESNGVDYTADYSSHSLMVGIKHQL